LIARLPVTARMGDTAVYLPHLMQPRGISARLQNVSKTKVESSGCMGTRENSEMSPNCCETNVLDQKSRAISSLEKRVT
jgi:hypothetical protein